MPEDLNPQQLKVLNFRFSCTNKKNWKLYDNCSLLEASPRKILCLWPLQAGILNITVHTATKVLKS